MREAQFLKQNADKWKSYEAEVSSHAAADILADRFIELTDDLSYSKTFYPDSNTTKYLNGLAAKFHQKIYRNKIEDKSRIWWFWQYELPFLFKKYHKQFLYAFLFFLLFVMMGVLSATYDENFTRIVIPNGDHYVNQTKENIEKGDPFAVYKDPNAFTMFLGIAFNNVKVAFIAYVLGATFSIGTIYFLFTNGVMVGAFLKFFFAHGLGSESILVIFIHGTLELWAMSIAGAAGLILGSSILFPKTFSRTHSFLRGGKDGLKIVIGLVPIITTAAFLESYVTRHTNMPVWVSMSILGASLAFIVWYFIIYPIRLYRKINRRKEQPSIFTTNSFDIWLNKKFTFGK